MIRLRFAKAGKQGFRLPEHGKRNCQARDKRRVHFGYNAAVFVCGANSLATCLRLFRRNRYGSRKEDCFIKPVGRIGKKRIGVSDVGALKQYAKARYDVDIHDFAVVELLGLAEKAREHEMAEPKPPARSMARRR